MSSGKNNIENDSSKTENNGKRKYVAITQAKYTVAPKNEFIILTTCHEVCGKCVVFVIGEVGVVGF